jgi:ribosomal protein S18 acetylase RimI-like enzyme
MRIRAFAETDRAAVIGLWRACGLTRDWNDPDKDVDRKVAEQPELFFVGEVDGVVVASVMAGYEGHRGWLSYLAVDPEKQGRGHGRALVEHAERLLLERGCPKVNLQVRAGNDAVLAVYATLGYAVDDVVSLGKRLIPD